MVCFGQQPAPTDVRVPPAQGTVAGDVGEGNSGGGLAIPAEMLEQFDQAGLLSDARKNLLGYAGGAGEE